MIIAIVIVALLFVTGVVIGHKKHHGGSGCIRNCAKCPHPCHHKGRF